MLSVTLLISFMMSYSKKTCRIRIYIQVIWISFLDDRVVKAQVDHMHIPFIRFMQQTNHRTLKGLEWNVCTQSNKAPFFASGAPYAIVTVRGTPAFSMRGLWCVFDLRSSNTVAIRLMLMTGTFSTLMSFISSYTETTMRAETLGHHETQYFPQATPLGSCNGLTAKSV